MFWRFGGYANISTIDTILDKPDFTLEELLDEGDLLQELKAHNTKLIEFLRDDAVLRSLLDYAVAPKLERFETPGDDNDDDDDDSGLGGSASGSARSGKGRMLFSRPRASSRSASEDGDDNSSNNDAQDAEDPDEADKRRNRYAFVACDVLSSDTWSIYEALTENRKLIADFWDFLKRDSPLDPLQASYFTKINESLFDRKTEDMMELLRSLPGAIEGLLKHVECPMIMDLLLKIIALDRTEGGQGVVEWLYGKDLIPSLLSFLSPEHSWVVQTAAGDFIKAIITISANASQNEQQCIGPNELTRQLVSKPCVEQLVGYMLSGGNPLTVGVGIVIEVIRKNNSDYDPDVGNGVNSPPSAHDPIYLGHLLRLFADNVPNFMKLILDGQTDKTPVQSTFGGKLQPLGFDRFKTCELMAELLHCSNMGLLNEPGSEDLILARDVERQRLRTEGRLGPQRDEDMSQDDLTMRSSHPQHDEGRRLEVINADDDGFEEVEPSREMSEDTSHEFVKPDTDMPSPGQTTTSIITKDDDEFVDEPLSSPRLTVTADRVNEQEEIDEQQDKKSEQAQEQEQEQDKDKDQQQADKPSQLPSTQLPEFEDPDLVVAPLSPTKAKSSSLSPTTVVIPETKLTEPEESVPASEERPDPLRKASTGSMTDEPTTGDDDGLALPVTGKPPTSPTHIEPPSGGDKGPFSPHPEDTPAPLFAAPAEPKSEEQANETREAEQKTETEQDKEQEKQPETEATPAHNPVVGDYLKMQFVDHSVVPTILSFFFSYPWNNFLHNVVYDVVQQVFNGPMDRGYNPTLAISLFESADVTSAIITGQQASDESHTKNRTRMGYMGHLTLIAEEVVKFTERHPPELLSDAVLDRVMSQEWISYVEGPLAETRERDNAILGGVRPEVALGHRSSIGGGGLGGMGLSGLSGGSGGGGGGASSVLAEAGLNGGIEFSNDGGSGGNNGGSLGPFAIGGAGLMSGFGSSSDEDDDDGDGDGDEDDVNSEVSDDYNTDEEEEEEQRALGFSGLARQFELEHEEELDRITHSPEAISDGGGVGAGASPDPDAMSDDPPDSFRRA